MTASSFDKFERPYAICAVDEAGNLIELVEVRAPRASIPSTRQAPSNRRPGPPSPTGLATCPIFWSLFLVKSFICLEGKSGKLGLSGKVS